MNVTPFPILELLLIVDFISGEYITSDYLHVLNDCNLSGNKLWATSVPSLLVCSAHCGKDGRCRSVSYERNLGTCILHDMRPSVCNGVGSPEPGWMLLWKFSVSCKPGWILRFNSCYLFSTIDGTWTNAKTSCLNYGAKLAEIGSSGEDTFLGTYSMANVGVAGVYWIGGTYIIEESRWIWGNGNVSLTYSNWRTGDPDTSRRDEHCMVLSGGDNYKWANVMCELNFCFICEEEL